MDIIKLKPIGIIHSEFKQKGNVPIQPSFSKSAGKVEVFPEYESGLKDLDRFSHIYLIYYFHKSENYELLVRPYLDEIQRGLFSTRAPNRPNNIGISVVELEKIEKNILHIKGVDIVDKTPLLDIKPYIKKFDIKNNAKEGWINNKITKDHKSDDRF
ncbi:tRNA (N6-threonylcarbamoyladenosine(37)-N6)-methyltransferase TrmO [Candidatus Woesearchaeota archaeon]|nr:tRNA (N6-threonylcarbamoyladenosine(37)-N6)-methyltransferase TrmO [Candidatus Woesearchaeota archaeon]